MAGFLTACALVKPGKTIFEVEPDSVKRKMKDKPFARGVSREDLLQGAQELGVPLAEHIAFCIAALRGIAPSWASNPNPPRDGNTCVARAVRVGSGSGSAPR